MTRGFAALLGVVEPSASAERVHVRFEWAGMPQGAAALTMFVLAAAVVLLVLALYRRERAGPGQGAPRMRWVCFGLRVLCLGVLGAILLRPSVARDLERLVPGRLLILADRSASMSIRDAHLSDESKRSWAQALALPEQERVTQLSRHDILRAMLERSGGRLVREASRTNQVELMTFADDVRTVLKVPRHEGLTDAPPSPAEVVVIPEWDPVGARTDLAGALRAAIRQPDTERMAGVVALTDGHDTEGGDLDAVARDAADAGIPLHFVGIGSPLMARNIAVAELSAGDRALKGLPLKMGAVIRSDGYAGQTVRLVLTATDVQGDGTEQILSKSVVLEGDGRRQVADLTHVPQNAGTVRYTARIASLEGESRTDDNSASAEVVVTDEKINVLLVAGPPSREYRFLKSLIERDPAFEAAVRLHGAAATDDGGAELPHDREGLLAYDVVLVCDPSPEDSSGDWLEMLADVVDREGVGLAFAAGPTHTPELVADPALQQLRDLLPVTVDAARNQALVGRSRYFTESRPAALSEEARGHAITDPGPGIEPREFWRSLPGLYWVLPAERAKPGATVLLWHGAREGTDGPARGTVLAAVHNYGLGRVFYCGSPETWRWRRRGIEHYERFWLQALRYCAAGRPGGRQRRARIEFDKSVYELGEPVRLRARLLDAAFRPIRDDVVELAVVREGSAAGAVRMRQKPGEEATYEGIYYPDGFGRFELTYSAPDGLQVTERLEVKRPDAEFDDPRMALAVMQKLARVTGGRYFGPSELGELPAAIPDRSRTLIEPGPLRPLWDTPYLLAALVAALAAEWLLRKRMGML